MKIGDLAEHYTGAIWGIIVGMDAHEYEVFWMDGDRTWITKKRMVKKCP